MLAAAAEPHLVCASHQKLRAAVCTSAIKGARPGPSSASSRRAADPVKPPPKFTQITPVDRRQQHPRDRKRAAKQASWQAFIPPGDALVTHYDVFLAAASCSTQQQVQELATELERRLQLAAQNPQVSPTQPATALPNATNDAPQSQAPVPSPTPQAQQQQPQVKQPQQPSNYTLQPKPPPQRPTPAPQPASDAHKTLVSHTSQPVTVSQVPPRHLTPAHAVLLLQRLSQICPSPLVQPSVMSEPAALQQEQEQQRARFASPLQPGAGLIANAAPRSSNKTDGLQRQSGVHDFGPQATSNLSTQQGTLPPAGTVDTRNPAQQTPTSRVLLDIATEPDEQDMSSGEGLDAQQQAARQELELLAGQLAGCATRGLTQLQPVEVCELLCALARVDVTQSHRAGHTQAAAEHMVKDGGLRSLMYGHSHALASVVWALAKSEYDPGSQWISQYLYISSYVIREWSAVDLAAVAWALGRWGFRPAEPWLNLYYNRLRELFPDVSCQGLANIAWALAVLQARPPAWVTEGIMIEAQVKLPSFTAAGLGTLAWSLATLDVKPPAFWVEEFTQVARDALWTVPKSARGLPFANILWALSCWQVVIPPPAWMQAVSGRVSAHMPVMSSTSLSVVLMAASDLGYEPEDKAWVSLALEEFHKRGLQDPGLDSQTLVAMLWAVSRLVTSPVYADSPHQQGTGGVPAAGNAEATDSSAAGREHERQEEEGEEEEIDLGSGGAEIDNAHEQQVQQQQDPAVQKVVVGRRAPPRKWLLQHSYILKDMAHALSERLHELKAPELVDALVAFTDLHYNPGPKWLDLHESCCDAVSTEFSAYQIKLMAKANRRLRAMHFGTYTSARPAAKITRLKMKQQQG